MTAPYAGLLRQTRQLRDVLVEQQIGVHEVLHLYEEKFMPRCKQIYDALRAGQIQEAIQLGQALLANKRIPVEVLQEQATRLLDLYVTSLESDPIEVAMGRLHVEVLDSKIVTLALGKLIMGRQEKYSEDIQKKANRKEEVYLIVLNSLGREKRER